MSEARLTGMSIHRLRPHLRRMGGLFGTPETRRMVSATLRPRAEFVLTGRAFMLHPATLYGFVLGLAMLATGMIKPEFTAPALSERASHALSGLKLAACWLAGWGLLGQCAWFAMHRGWPFFLLPAGLGVATALCFDGACALLIDGFQPGAGHFLRQVVVLLPATLFAVHVTTPLLRAGLGDSPCLVPVWSMPTSLGVPLMLKLPADRRGTLRRIHAANQYVEVITDRGTTLLRMSLRDAVAGVPAHTGWLCHRSLWISRDEIVAAAYVRGQPQIIDRAGQSWPISRSMAPHIRAWLHCGAKPPDAA